MPSWADALFCDLRYAARTVAALSRFRRGRGLDAGRGNWRFHRGFQRGRPVVVPQLAVPARRPPGVARVQRAYRYQRIQYRQHLPGLARAPDGVRIAHLDVSRRPVRPGRPNPGAHPLSGGGGQFPEHAGHCSAAGARFSPGRRPARRAEGCAARLWLLAVAVRRRSPRGREGRSTSTATWCGSPAFSPPLRNAAVGTGGRAAARADGRACGARP